MNRRINVSLPDKILQLIDQFAPRGDRSRFIAEAVSHYIEFTRKTELQQKLKEGANSSGGERLEFSRRMVLFGRRTSLILRHSC